MGSSPISKMSKPTQLASEDFDLALLGESGPADACYEKLAETIVGSLECDILPAMRSAVVPDDTVTALASCLQSASRQYVVSIPGVKLNDSKGAITHTEGANPRFSSDFHTLANEPLQGTSAGIVPSCRERFGYWAFDLLTHICHTSGEMTRLSDGMSYLMTMRPDQGPSELQEGQRRLAALFLPFFLDRCTGSIRAYLADAAIRGKLPFER